LLIPDLDIIPGLGDTMKYQISRDNKSNSTMGILEVVNIILMMIIAGSFNYLIVNFLFLISEGITHFRVGVFLFKTRLMVV
jgi:hypothetical protein